MIYKLDDCYCSYDNNTLTIGNSLVEREIIFIENRPVSNYIVNKKSSFRWVGQESEKKYAMFHLPILDFSKCSFSVLSKVSNNQGLSCDFLVVEIIYKQDSVIVKQEFSIVPRLPFITTRLYIKCDHLKKSLEKNTGNSEGHAYNGLENQLSHPNNDISHLPQEDTLDYFHIFDRHLKMQTIQLVDVTDKNDTLVHQYEQPLYTTREQSFAGSMFLLNSYIHKEEMMVIKEAPTPVAALHRTGEDCYVKPNSFVKIVGTGIDYENIPVGEFVPCYGCTVGVMDQGYGKSLYKQYYNQIYLGDRNEDLFIMSNTWGDRSQDKTVCESFLLKELECAKELGVDIVQIDDGWQKGITANSALSKKGVWGEGYYAFDPEFWTVHPEKFPNGLDPIIQLAKQYEIQIGLWFSPDLSNDYVNWERDAENLLNLYRKYDVKYFKLDGIKVNSKRTEMNLIKLMDTVSCESGREVTFNLDITAGERFGYLYEKQYGSIFVENRYTDFANYYPHATLKNLWDLSEVLPARKFQFEVLNHRRNMDKYVGDPLAPSQYSIEYIYACSMFANPLLWMEMCNLSQEDRQALAEFIEVYKKERKAVFLSEVQPIGDRPDGISFTGFQAVVNEKWGYFLLLKEQNEEEVYNYRMPSLENKKLKIETLYSNNADEEIFGKPFIDLTGGLQVRLKGKGVFVFAKYEIIS